jgi:hypothetical protein
MDGQSLLSGPLRWRAKAILIDSEHLTGVYEHGTCGTGMIVTNDLEFLENFFAQALSLIPHPWRPPARIPLLSRLGEEGIKGEGENTGAPVMIFQSLFR